MIGGRPQLVLPSGCRVEAPLQRMLAFCAGEYAYYDAILSARPNEIQPVDVLATVAMNSFVNSASRVRSVHLGMSERCDALLVSIPEDADLVDLSRWKEPVHQLLHEAVQAKFVLIPVATKVLHRKRRRLIPMLDSVILRYYLDTPAHRHLLAGTEDKKRAANVAMVALERFHEDLVSVEVQLESLRGSLALNGYELSPVRLLEVLIWTEVEPGGAYRAASA